MHTNEPWAVNRHGAIVGGPVIEYTNGSGQSQIAMVTGADWMAPGELLENARRIVACVNACAGIPTDVLEKGRLSPDAFRLEESRADKAERQRDELLAALEYAYDNRDTRHEYDSKYDSNCCGVHFGKPCDCHVDAVEKTLAAAIRQLFRRK